MRSTHAPPHRSGSRCAAASSSARAQSRRDRPALHLVRRRERNRRLPAPRPAQRRLEPAGGGRGDRRRRQGLSCGSRVQPRSPRRDRRARRTGEEAPRPRSDAGARQRSGRCAAATPRAGADARLGEATGLPVGLYAQGAAREGLLNAVVATRVGADLVATAVYPLALTVHRSPGESLVEALHGLGRATGVDIDAMWKAADLIDEHLGDAPVAPVAPRIAVRAAEYDLPAASWPPSTCTCARTRPQTGCSTRSARCRACARKRAGRRSRRRSGRSSPRRPSSTFSPPSATARCATSSAARRGRLRQTPAPIERRRARSRALRRALLPSTTTRRASRTSAKQPTASQRPRRTRPARDVR